MRIDLLTFALLTATGYSARLMNGALRLIAAATILLAVAIVFSPLVAAFSGTGIDTVHLTTAFHRIGLLLARSVGMAVVSGIVSLLFGVPFALLVERCGPGLRRTFWALGLTVLMVPPYIVAEAWIVLLGPAGLISRATAMAIGLGPRSNDPTELARYTVPGFVYTWPVVGLIMGGCLFPIVALAVASAFRRTDHRVFESARIAQGATGVTRIVARVLVGPAIGAGLLVFAATLTEFAVPQLLRVRSIGEAIYEQIQEGDLGAAAALSLPSLPLVFIAGALGIVVLGRSRVASMAGLEGEIPKFSGQRAGGMINLAAGVITVLVITPALILPVTSLTWLTFHAKLPTASAVGTHNLLRASGFLDSLHGAWTLAQDDALRTVVLAAIAATAAIIFAISVARFASRLGWNWMLGALGAGLAIPSPIVGLGLIALWNHEPGAVIYQSPVIVLLAWFARFFPVVIFLVQGALARVPSELEHAAALAGRGPLERLLTIVVRNAAPGLVAAWLAMYVLCATEFTATFLIAPPGYPLLAPSIVNLMRRGQDPEIAACQFLLLAVVALPLVAICLGWIARRQLR